MSKLISDYSVAELEAALRSAKQRDEADRKARLESVTPVYQFTLEPVAVQHFGEEIWDDTLCGYRLTGTVLNRDEMEAAGHGRVHEGGMTYLFNWNTEKFVMTLGGGSTFLSTRGTFAGPDKVEHAHATLDRLARFVVANPKGGDVTEIVENHRSYVPQCIHEGVFAGSDNTPVWCRHCRTHVPVSEL